MLRLFVGNLPPEAREKDVRALFDEFGTVRSIDLAHDIFTGKCKGFCFVEMEGHEARAAVAGLNGKLFGNKNLKVAFDDKRKKGRGGRR